MHIVQMFSPRTVECNITCKSGLMEIELLKLQKSCTIFVTQCYEM